MRMRKTPDGPPGEPAVTPEIAAEAAMWIARLHGPARSRQMELDCLAWQARSAAHRHAFERCTDAWEMAGALGTAGPSAAVAGAGPSTLPRADPFEARWMMGVLAVILLIGCFVLWQHWRDQNGWRTGVGEQKVAMLDDGSRVHLNTDTELRVQIDRKLRRITLLRGEALFEVAKDARPFVVQADDNEVVALGTAFVVRWTGDVGDRRASVLLMEGQVSVRPVENSGRAAYAPLLVQQGERVRMPAAEAAPGDTAPQAPSVDRPSLELLTAWRRSEVVFDGTPLTEAIAEMNRYSPVPLVLVAPPGSPGQADRRVSGVFRTGDSERFARAVAALHGLSLRPGNRRLELVAPPRASAPHRHI